MAEVNGSKLKLKVNFAEEEGWDGSAVCTALLLIRGKLSQTPACFNLPCLPCIKLIVFFPPPPNRWHAGKFINL